MSIDKKITGYKIDFTTNTLIMNYKFAEESKEYGTAEYKLLRKILKDFPDMKIEIKAGRETKSTRSNKRLTYENMEKHISVYDNAKELLDVFETVKMASKVARSPYKYVSDWFVKQFPNYKEAPTFKNGKLVVMPIEPPVVEDYKVKLAKVG